MSWTFLCCFLGEKKNTTKNLKRNAPLFHPRHGFGPVRYVLLCFWHAPEHPPAVPFRLFCVYVCVLFSENGFETLSAAARNPRCCHQLFSLGKLYGMGFSRRETESTTIALPRYRAAWKGKSFIEVIFLNPFTEVCSTRLEILLSFSQPSWAIATLRNWPRTVPQTFPKQRGIV